MNPRLQSLLKELVRAGRLPLTTVFESYGVDRETLEELSKVAMLSVTEGEVAVTDKALFILGLWRSGVVGPTELLLEAGWHEFERLCAYALNEAGYQTILNLKFRWRGRRYELDVVGLNRPRALVIDCKDWRRFNAYMLKRAAESQVLRAQAFASALRSSNLLAGYVQGWGSVLVYPVVVGLFEGRLTMHGGVPIVPLPKLRGFLASFEEFGDELHVELAAGA